MTSCGMLMRDGSFDDLSSPPSTTGSTRSTISHFRIYGSDSEDLEADDQPGDLPLEVALHNASAGKLDSDSDCEVRREAREAAIAAAGELDGLRGKIGTGWASVGSDGSPGLQASDHAEEIRRLKSALVDYETRTQDLTSCVEVMVESTQKRIRRLTRRTKRYEEAQRVLRNEVTKFKLLCQRLRASPDEQDSSRYGSNHSTGSPISSPSSPSSRRFSSQEGDVDSLFKLGPRAIPPSRRRRLATKEKQLEASSPSSLAVLSTTLSGWAVSAGSGLSTWWQATPEEEPYEEDGAPAQSNHEMVGESNGCMQADEKVRRALSSHSYT